jgi:hypothetical protein
MEMTYDNILSWIKEYFDVYSKYGQEPKSADRMLKYFTPELRFIPYIAPIGGPEGGFKSREEFINTAVAHTGWYEKLTPVEITIDERRKTVAVLFLIDVYDRKTGKVTVKRSAFSHYDLILDKNDTIKIKTIKFFWEVLPVGVPEFFELYPEKPGERTKEGKK